MDPERWKLVDRLLHAALERPAPGRAEYLKQACAGDRTLEQEVLSLLSADNDAGSFLKATAPPDRRRQIEELYQAVQERGRVALANTDPDIRREVEKLLTVNSDGQILNLPPANAPEDSTVTHLAGQTVSHYQIQEMLGAGGMGVVYKAFDTKLDRHVALKFLPPHLRLNRELKQRLKQEARAASALDHPNIVVIHDIDETPGGDVFIAMAFHEGATLRHIIQGVPSGQGVPGGLPVAEALQIARQIAAGLARAHERGIFHRDIKPANVIVAKDGVTRIIDFGLAQSSENTATMDGKARGTPLYMSPEQALGQPLDQRTDLWSLGAVLYEMLAGQPPFRGETQLQLMRAVVDDEPRPLRELRPEVPAEVEAIVTRALVKDRSKRYQSAKEIVQDLSAALGDLDFSSGARTAAQPARSARRRLMYGVAALAMLAAVALAAWRFGGRQKPVTSASEYVQITNFTDLATGPALSPDGRTLAFLRGGPGFPTVGDVYVKLLPNGESRQLTDDGIAKYGLAFSPDGSRVAFTEITPKTYSWDTWTVPVLGGPPSRLMVNAAGFSWISPDRVLFSEIEKGTTLHMGVVTASENRAEERPIYFPPHERGMAHYSWPSPDRSSLLIVEMSAGGWLRCRIAPMDGKSPGVQIGPEGACTEAAWSPDGEWAYLTVEVNGNSHIWRQAWRDRAPYGNPEQITFGPTEERGLAMAPDGKSLIASVGVRQSSVWMHDAKGDRMVSQEGFASAPLLSGDGRRLYYLLQRNNLSDIRDLWKRDLVSGTVSPLLEGRRIRDYRLSPDESQVAFTAAEAGGESDIFLAAVNRSAPPHQVVRGGSFVSFGAGGELLFMQISAQANYLARVHPDGSALERIQNLRITEKMGVSPDGEWETAGDADGVSGSFAVSVNGQARRQFCTGECHVQFSPDGKYLYLTVGSLTKTEGQTYIVPIPNGIAALKLPPDGFDGEGGLAGLRSIPQMGVAPGPNPETYAYVKATFQGNLFRIPLH